MPALVKFSLEDLTASFEQIPPADLLGVELLKTYWPQPGQLLPTNVPRDEVIAAAKQIVEYGTRCGECLERLINLQATAVETHDVPEFGL